MLLKSGINLSEQLLKFISESESLYLFVPYIKLESLNRLLSSSNSCKAIIVRWEPRDLILGASDLDLYTYCKEHNIALYRNPRIHLKAFIDQYQKCILGSANISSRALNLPENDFYNYELATEKHNLSIEDKLYFEVIINESILITDSIYQQIKAQLPEKLATFPNEYDFKLELKASDKNFLISSLPMSYSVDSLINVYTNPNKYTKTEIDCMVHDIALYHVPLGLEHKELRRAIAESFFTHPFISCFLKELNKQGEMYFGKVKQWIHTNCTDVPLPRKWKITENIQILYNWISDLGEGKYVVDRPNHSQRIRFLNS